MRRRRGNCYVTCEALFHLLGGKAAGWTPRTVQHEGDAHWYLVRIVEFPDLNGLWSRVSTIVDPTVSQFKTKPDYSKGRGRGFLTKKPSKRARVLMDQLVFQP